MNVDLQHCYEMQGESDAALIDFDIYGAGLFSCEAGLTEFEVGLAILSAMLLLVLFIQSDLAGAIILFHLGNVWGKFAALVLFVEGMTFRNTRNNTLCVYNIR